MEKPEIIIGKKETWDEKNDTDLVEYQCSVCGKKLATVIEGWHITQVIAGYSCPHFRYEVWGNAWYKSSDYEWLREEYDRALNEGMVIKQGASIHLWIPQ